MTPKKQEELKQHLQAIAEILYEEADDIQLSNLAGIEETMLSISRNDRREKH